MAWVYLLIAGLCECGWAIGLKATEGFTRWAPIVPTAVAMAASLGLLTLALRTLPVGTAYAVWTGIGATGTAILGVVVFKEPVTALKLGSFALVILGLAGLKVAGG